MSPPVTDFKAKAAEIFRTPTETPDETIALIAAALEAVAREEREACTKILDEEIADTSECDWGPLPNSETNVRAWLMNARARIRARSEKGGSE
jgi:hypothetical protein